MAPEHPTKEQESELHTESESDAEYEYDSDEYDDEDSMLDDPNLSPELVAAGWTSQLDASSNQLYYYNLRINVTQWDPPQLEDIFWIVGSYSPLCVMILVCYCVLCYLASLAGTLDNRGGKL